jgi:hypothetical protein
MPALLLTVSWFASVSVSILVVRVIYGGSARR